MKFFLMTLYFFLVGAVLKLTIEKIAPAIAFHYLPETVLAVTMLTSLIITQKTNTFLDKRRGIDTTTREYKTAYTFEWDKIKGLTPWIGGGIVLIALADLYHAFFK